MEDDLKILKVEYLSNHLLDHTQILNLSLYDQTIFYESFLWRQPPKKDDLQILKVEYISKNLFKWRQPPIENNLKIFKVEYLSKNLLGLTQI